LTNIKKILNENAKQISHLDQNAKCETRNFSR